MEIWTLAVVAIVGWFVFKWGVHYGRDQCARLAERLEEIGHTTSGDIAKAIRSGDMFSESGFYRHLIPEEKLMYLIKRNLRPKEISELITAGTNLSYRNKDGLTPIIMATKYFPGFNYQNTGRRIALLRALLEVSPRDVVNVQDNQGFTALMYAAEQSDQFSIALLLHHGADRSMRNRDGLSALDFAKPPFTRALLEKGEDQDRLLAVLSKYELA